MRRATVVAVIVVSGWVVAAAPAGATNECHGLQVCVPVSGPWIVATSAGVEYQLSCPKRFIVGGLDAELSSRALDIGFEGGLGSPVNPGITTSGAAVFLGRFVGRSGVGSFRPHIGCIPASGGGQRAPTAYQVFKPGKPTMRLVSELAVSPGTRRVTSSCLTGQRLVRATYAVGFYTFTPPAPALIANMSVRQSVHAGKVHTEVHAGTAFRGLPAVAAIVQVELLCAVNT